MSLTRKIKLIKKLVSDLEKEIDDNYFEMHNRKYYLKKGKLFSSSDNLKSVGHITSKGSLVIKSKSKTKSNIKKTNNKSRSIPKVNSKILHATNDVSNEDNINFSNSNISSLEETPESIQPISNSNISSLEETPESIKPISNTNISSLEETPESIKPISNSNISSLEETPENESISLVENYQNVGEKLANTTSSEPLSPNELTTQKVIPSVDLDSIRD